MGGRSSSDDAVINDNQSFALYDFHQRVEFLTNSQVPEPLFRFDECPADIAILN
ncbi:MAG: hypothetical protein CM1200mP22_26710 [Dehalococcoidia bacterium]|nr:MAG: hypothetical protein CM1200mP22_26710 [Dehalococcoidia bacterium]